MKKNIWKLLTIPALLLICFVYYYVTLPAINLHSPGLWTFILGFIAILFAAYTLYKRTQSNPIVVKGFTITLAAVLIIFFAGSILSSPIINAKKYCNLINISERNFTEDIKTVSYNEIPSLDKASAEKLGLRKMGSMQDMVSQFEVSNLYSQINYNQRPTRVTPLLYGNTFKWLTNRSNGIPAYMRIDMTTQDVECVRLEEGIKYSFSEPLNRNVLRYLRFHYPTYIFDTINFEIDDNGTPYWICPVRDYTIGLFGGITIQNVVLLNAVTGELQNYPINEVPNWVDKVYSAELLISYYDYYGELSNGYLNSILGQKGCLQTTDGYNYIALEDDVWVYTGVTSVAGDESNVGFVLMNQRTAETRYYSISGAEEYSAMASAEGQVQNLGYVATFPLLLNIDNQPTYFIALKDNAGLVKCYAMVNIEKYQIVAIGDSIAECEENYIKLLSDSGITENVTEEVVLDDITGLITKITEVTVEGNTHYYLKLDNSDQLFDVDVPNNISVLNYTVGSTISLTYKSGSSYNTVIKIQ